MHKRLFQDLSLSLQLFVKQARGSHTSTTGTMSAEERCLRAVETLHATVEGFLDPKLMIEKEAEIFTLSRYKSFIFCLQSAKPAPIVRKKTEASGFLWLNSTVTEETTEGWLGSSLNALITHLQGQLAEAEKKEKEEEGKKDKKTYEKSGNSEEKTMEKDESASRLSAIENQMQELQKQVGKTQELINEAHKQGRRQGQEDIIAYVKNLVPYLPQQQRQGLLQYISQYGHYLTAAPFSEGTTSTASTSSTPAATFQSLFQPPPGSTLVVTEIEEVCEKEDNKKPAATRVNPESKEEQLKRLMGEVKFSVVKKVAETYRSTSSTLSSAEKRLARWIIFTTMAHVDDKTISEIFNSINERLSSACGKDIVNFANLKPIYQQYQNQQDIITNKPLSADQLHCFRESLKNDGFLFKDGTGSNYFDSMYATAKGNNVTTVTSEENYIANAINNLKKDLGITTTVTNALNLKT